MNGKFSFIFWHLPYKRKQEDKIPRVVEKFVRSPGCQDYFTSAYTYNSSGGGWPGWARLGQSVSGEAGFKISCSLELSMFSVQWPGRWFYQSTVIVKCAEGLLWRQLRTSSRRALSSSYHL